jgi:membrane protein implicated in regulation of membrane protease activity
MVKILQLRVISLIMGLLAWILLGLVMLADLPYDYDIILFVASSIFLVTCFYLFNRSNKKEE